MESYGTYLLDSFFQSHENYMPTRPLQIINVSTLVCSRFLKLCVTPSIMTGVFGGAVSQGETGGGAAAGWGLLLAVLRS